MNRAWATGLLFLAIGCALAMGCGHAPPVERPYPAPSAETLLAWLAARQHDVPGMSARVRATSWLGGERVRATVNMLVERDGRLRFEAEVSLQGTVATLATDGTSFALYDVRKNQLSRGPACPANVASLIRIPLAPAEVAAVLLGDARLPNPVEGPPAIDWNAALGADVLTVRDRAGGALQLLFHGTDAGRDLIGAARMDVTGGRVWRTSYQDFEGIAGRRSPRTVLFAEQNGSFDDGVEIKFKDRTIDGAAPPAAFTLVPAQGVQVREVGCGAAP